MAQYDSNGAAIPFRVMSLEKNEMQTREELRRLGDRTAKGEAQIDAIHEDIKSLDSSVSNLSGQLNKVFWTLVGLSVTIAGSAVTVAMTIGGHA